MLVEMGSLLVGTLFIISAWQDLSFFDMTTGDPASHLDPEYLHFDKFKEAYEAGYDGVKVPDLLQSERWGNFGHDSYGGLPRFHKETPL